MLSEGTEGLSFGNKGLDNVLFGLQTECYYLVYAGEGVGKSTFALTQMVFEPILSYIKNKDYEKYALNVLFYSLEVGLEDIFGKLICYDLYKNEGILIDINILFSKGTSEERFVLTDEVQRKIAAREKVLRPIFDNYINVITTVSNVDIIIKQVDTFYEKKGKVEIEGENTIYTPNNPLDRTIVIVDTFGNLEGTGDKKRLIDKLSRKMVFWRDVYKTTCIGVIHAGRANTDPSRVKTGCTPITSDILDSGNPSRDASVVLALYNPSIYKDISPAAKEFLNYKVETLGNRFRVLFVQKNRNGDVGGVKPYIYLGECGAFLDILPEKQVNYSSINSIKKTYAVERKVNGKWSKVY